MGNQFEIDVTAIRDDAREQMSAGAVTAGNRGLVDRVVEVLDAVLATEIVCYLRYTQNAITASGIHSARVAAEFTEHAAEELDHAVRVAERIDQLGGTVDMDPTTLAARSHTEYTTADETDLDTMLRENLVAERIVITTYQEIIRWLGDDDPTTRTLMESLLAEEEEHADDLGDLLGY